MDRVRRKRGRERKPPGAQSTLLRSYTARLDPPQGTSVPLTTAEALRCHDGSCFTTTPERTKLPVLINRPPDIRGRFDWDNRRDPVQSASLLSLFGREIALIAYTRNRNAACIALVIHEITLRIYSRLSAISQRLRRNLFLKP